MAAAIRSALAPTRARDAAGRSAPCVARRITCTRRRDPPAPRDALRPPPARRPRTATRPTGRLPHLLHSTELAIRPSTSSPLHGRVRTSGRHAAARIEPGVAAAAPNEKRAPRPMLRKRLLRTTRTSAAARAYTPASARGKRASARPRRVLAPIVPSERPTRLAGGEPFMDTSSQRFAAASHECSSGTASDRVPPGACSSSLAETSAITRRTLAIARASDGLGPTRRTDLFSPYGVRSSRESR